MSATKNPRELLERAMELIHKDLDHLESKVKTGKLSHDNAQDLARYSTALLSIAKDGDEDEAKKRKSVQQLTPEELEKKAREYLENKGV